MPELPEVQTIVSQLVNSIIGRTVLNCKVLRQSIVREDSNRFRKNIKQRKILDVGRRGKYIVFSLSESTWLIAHLKMTGKFIIRKSDLEHGKHDRVLFHLDNNMTLVFNDVRCFGLLKTTTEINDFDGIRKLGWDPWDKHLTVKSLSRKIEKRQTSIKAILLDQSVISGIGNIYASEILFKAGIHPGTGINTLTDRQTQDLLVSIRNILSLALRYNGTSISDYRQIDDKQGEFQNFLKVYGKEGQLCGTCSTRIMKINQNQRSTFFCPICQK